MLQVGVDPKAVADAWMRIEKKHGDKLAALFVSVDESKGKALAYAGGCPGGAIVWLAKVGGKTFDMWITWCRACLAYNSDFRG